MEKLCKTEFEAVNESNPRCESTTVEEIVAEQNGLRESWRTASQSVDAKQSQRFIRFLDALNNVEETISQQNTEQSSHSAKIDPLTKQPIRNPVRNTRCGHVYDKSSIISALRQNPRLR